MAKKTKVVCFGGGTGLPVLLSGLKKNPWVELTAIVTMFDTGGSSGELKDKFGILPPGDVLKCILALSEDENATRKILLTRILHDSYPGHTAGNILLFGLERVFGNFAEAAQILGQILSISGKVYPVALFHSSLAAHFEDGTVARGETNIDLAIYEGKLPSKLFLDPPVQANAQALKAIEEADVFCVGPGSFYTSILPNFLPQGVREAIRRSNAPIIFTTNILTEGYGMRDCTARRIISVLEGYLGRGIAKAIVNTKRHDESLNAYAEERKYPISWAGIERDQKFILAELWDDPDLARHNQNKLGFLVGNLIHELAGQSKQAA